MAPEKQRRLLKKCPEIVVATPGRLWELIDEVRIGKLMYPCPCKICFQKI